MSANINDYFNKASNMNGSYPAIATVSSARSTGGSTLSCDDLSSWATDTPVHFSTFKVAADGTIDTSTQTDWKGIVVGNTITEMTRLAGAADSGNASGDKVELNPTIGWLDDLITGILVSHKQDGTLKDSIVGTSAIADSAVTTAKINGSAVTSAKLASNAVTTAKINDGAVTSAKIDFSTLSGNYSTSETDTGFTWIDGKTIYKKTVGPLNFPTSSGTNASTAHNITGIKEILKIDGVAKNTSGAFLPLSYGDGSNNDMVTYASSNHVTIYSVSNKSGWTGYATLYYTKSS